MSIDQVSSNEELQKLLQSQGIKSTEESGEMPPPPPPEGMQSIQDILSVTDMGSLLSETSSLTEEEQEEVKEWFAEVMGSIKSGNYDAEALAESAPEALKNLAAEEGIDLAGAITETADTLEQLKPPEGPPPMMAMGGGGDDESEEETILDILSDDDEESTEDTESV